MSTEARDRGIAQVIAKRQFGLSHNAWLSNDYEMGFGAGVEAGWDARGQVTPDREAIARAISIELARRTNWEENDSPGLTPGTDMRLADAVLALFNEKGNE